jgi:hypothetical protein
MKRSCALVVVAVVTSILTLEAHAARPGGAEDFPVNACVADKQAEAARYCRDTLHAWAQWFQTAKSDQRDGSLLQSADRFDSRWAEAEGRSLAQGSDCSQTTLSASAARGTVDSAVQDVVANLLEDLDGNGKGRSQAACAGQLLRRAALRCEQLLRAESDFVGHPASDPGGLLRDTARARAEMRFERTADQGNPSCEFDSGAVAHAVDSAVDAIVRDTTASPQVPQSEFATYSPTEPVSYQGREFVAGCVFDTPYHYFAKRGTVNKLVMYYQGGGACWEQLTCEVPVCDSSVNPNGSDNPNNVASGFADFDNPENPFREWHMVFVSYCSCDVHYGDISQVYDNLNPDNPVPADHRGFQNAKIVEKWAREHFVVPEEVFVTGSSAGAYGALFHGPGLHDAWPAAQVHVLGDAGSGVITPEFLQNEFENWNFRANLPKDIPGVLESIDQGTGMVGYIDAVAHAFPTTNWAHYTAAFDGGTGGQTGFYNVMLNNNEPLAALTWWNGSCEFNRVMREQAFETAVLAPDNYRYYIGSGSRHTMWGSNKVYTDTLGGVPRIVDWISAMLSSREGAADPAWANVEAEPFNVLLPGDPSPALIPTLPFVMDGPNLVVDCN